MQPTSELVSSALRARTFGSMGTVISLAVPASAVPGTAAGAVLDDAAAAVERVFARLDEAFSLYRPDSEASRLARGELSVRDASAGMRDRYADALSWRLQDGGRVLPGTARRRAGPLRDHQGVRDRRRPARRCAAAGSPTGA